MTLSVVKDDRHRIACGCLVAGVVAVVVLVGIMLAGGFGAGARFFLPAIQQNFTPEFISFAEKQRPGAGHHLVLVEHQSSEKLIKVVNNNYKVPAVDGLEFSDSATVTINCPIVYSYYVDLKETWKVTLKDGEMVVEAPLLRLDKPAVDVVRAHQEIQGGGQVFGDDRILQDIGRELSVRLYNVAMQPDHFKHFREPSRKALEDFMWAWVGASGHQVKTLKIKFVDDRETTPVSSLSRPVRVDSVPVNGSVTPAVPVAPVAPAAPAVPPVK